MFEHKGKQYARVSDIIRPFCSFGHIDAAVLNNKARIGTAVHQVISDDLNEEFVVTTSETSGYFNSYRKWKEEINPYFMQWETRYFCDEKMLTGQIDAVVRMPNEAVPVLIDWKTSAQESSVTWQMQAHLYRHLLFKNYVDIGTRFLFIRLNKEGLYPAVHVYSFTGHIHNKCMTAIEDFWKTEKK